MRRGDRGSAVKALQQGLICYGALKEGGDDGSYGAGTEKAVKAVQQAEGFAADGVAWPQTQRVLGHVFGDWETLSELSDFSKGIRQRVCRRCGF
ncbi:MAG: peptidoglycan-binding protein, partial [Thermoguttaceae bacterium]|nr:peptidoglycan-binding protein [Thermoguttaceae bacterium]